MDDADKFDALRLAFEVVQIPSEKIEAIFAVVSAILWLGNLKFQVINMRILIYQAKTKLKDKKFWTDVRIINYNEINKLFF